MKLQIKRIYEEPSADDGKRIFVDRLWVRGMTKERAKIDSWEKDLAPSKELRKWYGHIPERFEEFRRRYHEELDENPKAADFAEKLSKTDGTVTLLFGAKDTEHNNAVVLKEWLEDHLSR